MNDRVDFSRLTAISEMKGDSAEDSRLLSKMADEARQYLCSFTWCKEVKAGWFGWGVGGVCAVFFFEIVPSKSNVDSGLWIVVGDLPSAYLVTDGIPTPLAALETYLDLMQEWVDAVMAQESTDRCIPVNASPTRENADLLYRRLAFIRQHILR